MSYFPAAKEPLASRMRPRKLDEFVGQEHLLAANHPFRRTVESGNPQSLILWGPPGTGKTTLGLLIAKACKLPFHHLSAVTFSVRDIKELVATSEGDLWGGRMLVFLDEIHRLNKGQQDVLLPYVENGRIVLIGATTENPAFEVNRALLSRCKVFRLQPLSDEALRAIVRLALADGLRGLGRLGLSIEDEALDAILRYAGGDARAVLGILEGAAEQQFASAGEGSAITEDVVRESAGNLSVHHDKKGEEHYNVISAFIKSMRGGDPQATLYYLARMLEGGEDPRFILRRILIAASEDVGLADPVPLMVASAAAQAFDAVGLPEGRYHLAHAALTVCLAPKSNSVTTGIGAALSYVQQGGGRYRVPLHLHGASGPGEKKPKEYLYPHDFPEHHVAQQYLPDEVVRERFYEPTCQGREESIRKLLHRWEQAGKTDNHEPGDENS